MNMGKSDKKTLFRKKVLKELRKKRVNNYKKDKLIIKKLNQLIKKSKYKNIMLYIPLKNEVNIMPLIINLRQKGYNLYVPFMQNESFKLVKFRFPLEKK